VPLPPPPLFLPPLLHPPHAGTPRLLKIQQREDLRESTLRPIDIGPKIRKRGAVHLLNIKKDSLDFLLALAQVNAPCRSRAPTTDDQGLQKEAQTFQNLHDITLSRMLSLQPVITLRSLRRDAKIIRSMMLFLKKIPEDLETRIFLHVKGLERSTAPRPAVIHQRGKVKETPLTETRLQ